MKAGDPIVGGTILRTPAIQSPGYVPGTSGWSISQDGSAEFEDLTVRGGQAVPKITIAASAPASPQAGDLWYDSGNGYRLNQYEAGAWSPYQIGTNAIAGGAITAALIAANTITAAQIASGTITAGQIAAGTITGALIAAATITASNIEAGTITAAQIAANSITASLIGSLGPLNPNPFLTGDDDTTWFANSASSSGATGSPPSGAPYPYAYAVTADGSGAVRIGQLASAGNGPFAVVAGNQYFVAGWIYSSAALTFDVGLTWLSSSYGIVSSSALANTVPANTWTPVVAVVTAPSSGVAAARVILTSTTTPASGTDIYVAGMTVSPQVPGTLIEADSITAGQIAAGTITAAEIAAGTVVAGIVDGTTIEGATVIAGTTGNPQIQMTSSGGLGLIEFPVPVTGFTLSQILAAVIGSGTTAYLSTTINGAINSKHADWTGIEIGSSDGTASAYIYFVYNDTAGTAYYMAHVDDTGFVGTAATVTGAAPGSSPATADAWHGLGVPTGWTGLLTAGGGSQGGRYVKMAEQQAVWVDIAMTAPSGGSGTTVTFPYSIASGWRPKQTRNYPVAINAATAENARINIGAGGVCEIFGLPSGFTGNLSASFMIPLD